MGLRVRSALGLWVLFLPGTGSAQDEPLTVCPPAVQLEGDGWAVAAVRDAAAKRGVVVDTTKDCPALRIRVTASARGLLLEVLRRAHPAQLLANDFDAAAAFVEAEAMAPLERFDDAPSPFAIDVDAEVTAIDGCCIFAGYAGGLLATLTYASGPVRLGAGTRIFFVVTPNTARAPFGGDTLVLAEFPLRWEWLQIAPALGVGAELFSGSSVSFGPTLESAVNAAIYASDAWAFHCRLAFSWTPLNQPAGNPLSYVRLGFGIEWGRVEIHGR